MNLVIFKVADKEYGIDIRQVRQVIRMREPVPVPESAHFIEGVISLGSRVVPLVNLRKKLGLTAGVFSKTGRIILTEADDHPTGVIVDSVTDVVAIEKGSISAPDELLKDAKYLVGMVKIGNRLILIADMAKILSPEDKDSVNSVRGRVEIKKRGH